jgi:transcription elongation factor SPT6
LVKGQPEQEPPRSSRIITPPCFKRVSAREAENDLLTQPNGSYVIRPTTSDPDKLSVTWKIHDNIYRHFRKFQNLC